MASCCGGSGGGGPAAAAAAGEPPAAAAAEEPPAFFAAFAARSACNLATAARRARPPFFGMARSCKAVDRRDVHVAACGGRVRVAGCRGRARTACSPPHRARTPLQPTPSAARSDSGECVGRAERSAADGAHRHRRGCPAADRSPVRIGRPQRAGGRATVRGGAQWGLAHGPSPRAAQGVGARLGERAVARSTGAATAAGAAALPEWTSLANCRERLAGLHASESRCGRRRAGERAARGRWGTPAAPTPRGGACGSRLRHRTRQRGERGPEYD